MSDELDSKEVSRTKRAPLDVAKAVAAIENIAKASPVPVTPRATAAGDIAKAVASIQVVAKAAAVSDVARSSIASDVAKAVASIQDVAKAVAIADVAKAAAAVDVAKAVAAIQDIAKQTAAPELLQTATDVQYAVESSLGGMERDESFAALTALVASTESPEAMDLIISELGRLDSAYREIASRAAEIVEAAKKRKVRGSGKGAL